MARRRFIHPDFFLDEALVTLPPFTRLLFAGLWCLADREGRLLDKPVKIKMQLFPADQVDVGTALDDLSRLGMVTRYVADGQRCLQINAFGRYQHPHPKEAPSVIPPRGMLQATPRCVPDNAQVDPEPRLGVVEQGGYSGSSDTQDLRILGPSEAAPPAHPAPSRPRAPMKPLAYKPRIDTAWPGRPPVPGSLHAEFRDKLGGDPETADGRLFAWYPQAAAAWADRPIGDDDFAFWRHRFREWIGSTRQATRTRAAPPPSSFGEEDWCQHNPPCNSREWHAVVMAGKQEPSREEASG